MEFPVIRHSLSPERAGLMDIYCTSSVHMIILIDLMFLKKTFMIKTNFTLLESHSHNQFEKSKVKQ